MSRQGAISQKKATFSNTVVRTSNLIVKYLIILQDELGRTVNGNPIIVYRFVVYLAILPVLNNELGKTCREVIVA
jgi:hypothetical protein